MSEAQKNGHLVIIGGSEDRKEDMPILTRFVELCGGPGAKIVVITAASQVADQMWEMYDSAFSALGVTRHSHLEVTSRQDANSPDYVRQVAEADGIFMTGGDQKRLLARTVYGWIEDGMALEQALRRGLDLFDQEVDVGLIAVSRTEAAALCYHGMPQARMTQR